jgi:hypothetical protein
MKTRYLLLSLLIVPTILFAMLSVPYDTTKPPSLSLPAGYAFAVGALGEETNQFYCTSAELSADSGALGWRFTFTSTNTPSKSKWVLVTVDGKTQIFLSGSIR